MERETRVGRELNHFNWKNIYRPTCQKCSIKMLYLNCCFVICFCLVSLFPSETPHLKSHTWNTLGLPTRAAQFQVGLRSWKVVIIVNMSQGMNRLVSAYLTTYLSNLCTPILKTLFKCKDDTGNQSVSIHAITTWISSILCWQELYSGCDPVKGWIRTWSSSPQKILLCCAPPRFHALCSGDSYCSCDVTLFTGIPMVVEFHVGVSHSGLYCCAKAISNTLGPIKVL